MSNVIISEQEYENLFYTKCTLDALEAGGIDNWEWYGESFSQDLEYWNDEHSEEQYKYWEDMADAIVEKAKKQTAKGIYILWEDGIIQGVYCSYDKTYEAMCAAIDKIDSVKVDWANEDCGFTTVYTAFGEKVEFEISDEYAVQ